MKNPILRVSRIRPLSLNVPSQRLQDVAVGLPIDGLDLSDRLQLQDTADVGKSDEHALD